MRSLGILLFFALWTASFGTTNIAVLDLSSDGIEKSTISAVSDRLRLELQNLGKYTVLERDQMDQILKEQEFQVSGATTEENAIKACNLLGVQKMVAGSLQKVGSLYILSIRLIDVSKGEIEAIAKEEISGDVEKVYTEGVASVVQKLTGNDNRYVLNPNKQGDSLSHCMQVKFQKGSLFEAGGVVSYTICGGEPTSILIQEFSYQRKAEVKKFEDMISRDPEAAKWIQQSHNDGSRAKFARGAILVSYNIALFGLLYYPLAKSQGQRQTAMIYGTVGLTTTGFFLLVNTIRGVFTKKQKDIETAVNKFNLHASCK